MAELGPFRILVDGHCPVCRQQADLLRRLDDGRSLIRIEDFTHPDFDPGRYGLTREQVSAEVHGITWDGRVLRGMDVFRKAYDLLGFGLLTAPTGWPLLRPITDLAYHWFARNRHRLGNLAGTCHSGTCRVR